MNYPNKTKEHMTSRDLQAENRRKQFIEAAKKLFAQKGYHGTTIRDINRAMGITEGLMYHYFRGGKHEILQVLVSEAIEEKRNNYITALTQYKEEFSIKESLTFFGNMILNFTTTDKDLMLIWLRDRNLIEKKYLDLYNDVTKVLTHKLTTVIQSFVKDNPNCKLDPSMMATQFFSSLSIFIMQEYVMGTEFIPDLNRENYLEKLVDYTLETWHF